MPSRQLARRRLLVFPSPSQETKEKLLFRQTSQVLRDLLKSNTRYCPSYKRYSSASEINFSNMGSSIDDVKLKESIGVKPMRLSLIEGTISSNSVTQRAFKSISEDSPRISLRNKHNIDGLRKYWRNPQKSATSFTNIKHAGKRISSSERNIFGNLGKPRTKVNAPTHVHPPKLYVHRKKQEISSDTPGDQSITSEGKGHCIAPVDESETNDQSFWAMNSMSQLDTDSDEDKQTSFDRSTSINRRQPRPRDCSIQCEVLGPLACKLCTRQLSFASASLTLSIQSRLSHSSLDITCPLCRKEQISSAGLISNGYSSRSTPAMQYYTPLDIFLRVRNQKRSQKPILNVIQHCGDCTRNEIGRNTDVCAETTFRCPEVFDTLSDDLGFDQPMNENRMKKAFAHVYNNRERPECCYREDSHADSFNGMRVTVRYIRTGESP